MEIRTIEPLYQQAYTELKKLILTGKIQPGEKIVTTKLAEQYQISRTPLREGLRHLQSEGLVIQEGTNFRVIELDEKDFKDLCSCRLTLEKDSLKSIIPAIDEKGIKELEEILIKTRQAVKEEDSLKVLELNTAFHETLIDFCSNKWLKQLLNQVRSLLLIYRANIIKHPEFIKEIYEEHMGIFNSVRDKDMDQSLFLVEQHLRNDRRRGLQGLSNRQD